MPDLTGQVYDRYRLLRLLGKGGMGFVYEAEHLAIGRRVALKILRSNLADDLEAGERMMREARAAADIGHPNIVETFDVSVSPDGVPFLVMEYLEGQTLGALIKEKGQLSHHLAVAITLQVLSALVAAHDKGIVHRDLKPDNIFIARSAHGGEEVKILDFGLSKYLDREHESLRLTRTGEVLGTPYYMSPEQASGIARVDHRSDLWSVGVMLYEAVCGELPFRGKNYNELIFAIVLSPFPPVRTHCPDLSAGLEASINQALEKAPEQRFQRATEMIEALLPFYDRTLAEAGRFILRPTLFGDEPLRDQVIINSTTRAECDLRSV